MYDITYLSACIIVTRRNLAYRTDGKRIYTRKLANTYC